ncbi:hypothetical protein BOX15_Mlig017776g1, partial [Macrostomum lignano]
KKYFYALTLDRTSRDMASASAICSVKFCRNQAEGPSPITDQPYCSQHLQADLSRCDKSEARVLDKIAHFKKYQAPMRLMQQRLASDLQLIDDEFANLRDTLDRCQAELTTAVTKHHDKIMESLGILAELDDSESELKAAKKEKDAKKAFLIAENLEKSLETLHLDSELVCMDEETNEVKLAAFPDVSSSVLDLCECTQVQLEVARQLVDGLDIRNDEESEIFKSEEKTIELDGCPVSMALCENTSGFCLDESGSVVRAQEAGNGRELTQRVAFVAVNPSSSERDSEGRGNEASRILIVSADGEVAGRINGSWDQPIRDLHCDTKLQLLFIVQDRQLIIDDMCGVEQSRVGVSDLQDDVQKLCCIAGDSDKLFILAERADGKPVIFGLSKKSNEVQLKLAVTGIDKMGTRPRISVRNRILFVDDGEKLHTVCSITGMLLSADSHKEARISCLDSRSKVHDRLNPSYFSCIMDLNVVWVNCVVSVPFQFDSAIQIEQSKGLVLNKGELNYIHT